MIYLDVYLVATSTLKGTSIQWLCEYQPIYVPVCGSFPRVTCYLIRYLLVPLKFHLFMILYTEQEIFCLYPLYLWCLQHYLVQSQKALVRQNAFSVLYFSFTDAFSVSFGTRLHAWIWPFHLINYISMHTTVIMLYMIRRMSVSLTSSASWWRSVQTLCSLVHLVDVYNLLFANCKQHNKHPPMLLSAHSPLRKAAFRNGMENFPDKWHSAVF